MFLNKYAPRRERFWGRLLSQQLIVNRFLLGAVIMVTSRSFILLILISLAAIKATSDDDFFTFVGRKQVQYETVELSDQQFATYTGLSNVNHLREAVDKILIPRVVGTKGHAKVRNYIVNTLKDLSWHVTLDKFEDHAPIKGKLEFQNIIATLNPNAERYLVLACHYDSKYMKNFEFLGATDSAVPCAMLLNMAHVMKDHLSTVRDRKLSLMFIFFDGEEAFDTWGPKDSIYGARHLAERWKSENLLDRIDMLMLLDLIGAPDPKFYSCFSNTEGWYAKLAVIEDRLSHAGLMERYTSNGVARHNPNQYFQTRSLNTLIEDDHIPFLNLGVPIVHLIPVPFPSIWHTKDDNLSIVDFTTTENINRVLRIFIMEYLLSYE